MALSAAVIRPQASFVLALVACCPLLACGGSKPADEGEAKTDEAKTDKAKTDKAPVEAEAKADAKQPDPPAPKLAENKFVAPKPDELEAAKAALAEHLDAGRKAVKAKDYATGIAELEKAAAINPTHAKTLGELGWAHFNAGELAKAKTRLEQGLHHADNDKTRGAILYNLGRVAEAQDDAVLAASLYARSVELRPNDVVAARLAGLERPETAAPAGQAHPQCGWQKHGPVPRHLCHAYLQSLPPEPDSEPFDAPACEYERTRLLGPEDLGGGEVFIAAGESDQVQIWDLKLGGGVEVAAFSYRDMWEMSEPLILNVVIDGVWYSSQLAWVSHPGVGYADENFSELKIRKEQLVPGGRPEVVVEWEIHGHDMDPGVDMEAFNSAKQIAVLSVEGSAPRWLAALSTRTEDSYDEIEAPDPETTVRSVELEWLAESGELKVSKTGDEPSAPLGSFKLGEYPQRCPAELF